MDNFNKGFTQLPHKVLNILPLLNLTGRQQKLVFLIIRLTYGCNKRWAKLKLSDLQVINIAPPHARKIIDSLVSKILILKNGKTKEYRLNEEYLASEVTKQVNSKLEQLRDLVKRQLAKDSYQISNKEVTKLVRVGLPKEKNLGYQNSKNEGLPYREVSDSKHHDFVTPKDILNKELNKEIESSNIADNSFKGRSKTSKKVNPAYFAPSNEVEFAAKTAWEQIEPNNPDSFGFYLWAIKQELPSSKFFEFASEIKADPTIKNKGAVFNNKVREYLGVTNA